MTDTIAPLARGRKARDPEGHMPLIEHVRELRNRVAVAAVSIVVGAVAGWLLYDRVFDFLTEPYRRLEVERPDGVFKVNFSTVASGFNVHVKVAFFVGVIVASPVWLYQIWAFIVPGLKSKEKKYAAAFVGAAVPLFLAGAYMATRAIPVAIRFLVGLTPDNASALQNVDNVLGFAIRLILAFGVMFVLPVLLVGLNMLGVLPSRTMAKGWRVAVFLIFVLAAMANPSPDPTSMLLLALPVTLLFALALGISYLNDRRRGRLSSEPDYSQFGDDEASPIEPAGHDDH